MSEPNALQPLRDAVLAAAAAAPVDKPSSAETEAARREADAGSIKRLFKTKGRDQAWRLARALQWTADEFEALIAPKKKPAPPKSPPAGVGEAGGGDAGAPPPPADDAAEPPADDEPASELPAADDPQWKRLKDPIKPLPNFFPVKPLGRLGGMFHYLDPLNQLRSLDAADHSAMGLRDLLAHEIEALWTHWPKWNSQTGKQSGFQADRVAESLMHACSKRGLFDATSRVRGAGSWLAENGGLVLHCGDGIFVDGAWQAPGEFGRYIYTAHEATPRPADDVAPAEARAAMEGLLKKLDSWNWRVDAFGDAGDMTYEGHAFASIILLGWLAASIVGGATRWRPMIWLTGVAGVGKSSLFTLIHVLLGDLVKVENATEASVRGMLGQSTRPVLLDEVENDPKSPKNQRLVELARIAASGGTATRSSSDHQVSSFTLRSAFMFSSIIIPPMMGADVSRFVVLDLDPITGSTALEIDTAKVSRWGRILRRRVVDGWARFEATLALWRETLVSTGHSKRGADTYGYVLAFVDLALWDEPADSDTRQALAGLVSREAIEQKTSGSDDTAAMLNFIGSVAVDAFRGGTKFTIGTLVNGASCGAGEALKEDSGIAGPASCAEVLRERGVYVERETRTRESFAGAPPENWKAGDWRVTLPNQHEGLRQIFDRSHWGTERGLTGAWAQGMRRLPGVLPENSRKLGGRGWSVPVSVFLQKEEKDGGN